MSLIGQATPILPYATLTKTNTNGDLHEYTPLLMDPADNTGIGVEVDGDRR